MDSKNIDYLLVQTPLQSKQNVNTKVQIVFVLWTTVVT